MCPNTDLCAPCYISKKGGPAGHDDTHEMLVFPTPAPLVLMTGAFAGLTCAYCARVGFAGAAYACASCPPGTTPAWCESWCVGGGGSRFGKRGGGAADNGGGEGGGGCPFCGAPAAKPPARTHALTLPTTTPCAPRSEIHQKHDKAHPRLKRIPPPTATQ